MSILNKKWVIKNLDRQKSAFERIIENRGFNGRDDMTDFHDPFLFEDMEKACVRIEKAMKNKERIIVFGDYDVDGISGTAILVHTLKKIHAEVSWRLPHRVEDGYGLSMKFIDEFIEKNIAVVITVDCGICCAKEIHKAKEHNIDTIVTDHHTIPEKYPDAHAILHPKLPKTNYPFNELTGAGVALKLAHALLQRNLPEYSQFFNSLLDLASLGTVADLGQLIGENRLIVKKGLEILSNTSWLGLRQIMDIARLKPGAKMDTTTIGFQIAPRINAAGRIGDPYTALSLLLQEEKNPKIDSLGKKLEELNTARQGLTQSAFEQLEAQLKDVKELPYMIIAHHPDWHVGILGLIAGKLAEKYGRPAIIMQDFGDTLVASARSPKFFNIIDAISQCGEYLVSFGGHAQAAGCSLKKENLDAFKEKIIAHTKENLKDSELKAVLEIDCELEPDEITLDFAEELENLAPFGAGNQRPTFVIRDVEPLLVNQVGAAKNHLKFLAKINEQNLDVIAFRLGSFGEKLRRHKKIDIVCQLEKNSWQDRVSLQLQALDFNIKE
ncbi:single-stranded-DNA-specific exonuclease RecJ [Candidatus Peregrinibacteria bacterium]|nr:single-stranded-DNA-specific exonuclease RecJ [Candidatus Peregrinibacteria bacterium]